MIFIEEDSPNVRGTARISPSASTSRLTGRRIPFSELNGADLIVDAIYEAGASKSIAGDPLAQLLPCGNQGGFRAARTRSRNAWAMAVLFSSGHDTDWPDVLDAESGHFLYYGDNKRPGHELHDTPRGGNKLLRSCFAALHNELPLRNEIPPFFVFTSIGTGRDVQFRGLAVPGSATVSPTQDLVAIWRSTSGQRFQNYLATFTVLDIAHIQRAWIHDLEMGAPMSPACPEAFAVWMESGRYIPLTASRTLEHRTRAQQLPASPSARWSVLETIYAYFRHDPHAFEACAATIWGLMAGGAVSHWDLTRPSRDGGRDAIGHYALGPMSDRVLIDFALEAKCYSPGSGSVGVRDVSRLISRLRHRQFGVLVTTSYVHEQAYREIRDDGHPVVIVCGQDIVEVLASRGINTPLDAERWLIRYFPRTAD